MHNTEKAGTYNFGDILCLILVWRITDIFVRSGVVVTRIFLDLLQICPVDHHYDRDAQVDTKCVAVDHAKERHQHQDEAA